MISLQESKSNQREWSAVSLIIDRLLRPTRQQLAPVQEAIREGFDENFQTESAGGVPWEQLSLTTVIDRVTKGFPGTHPILQRTRNYRASFADAGHADHVSEIQYQLGLVTLFEGTQDDRAQILELGSGRVPARPVLEMSNGSVDNVGETILDMIDGIIHAR